MAMPDAIEALLRLEAAAPGTADPRTAYNLSAFAPTAQDVHDASARRISRSSAELARSTEKRQAIVDSVARRRGRLGGTARLGLFAPVYDFPSAFRDYLLPTDPGALPVDGAAWRVGVFCLTVLAAGLAAVRHPGSGPRAHAGRARPRLEDPHLDVKALARDYGHAGAGRRPSDPRLRGRATTARPAWRDVGG
jgi:hypothetical protein